jgi:hypothetical protein
MIVPRIGRAVLPEHGKARRSASSQGSPDGRRPQVRIANAALDGENGVVPYIDRQSAPTRLLRHDISVEDVYFTLRAT